MVSVVAGDAATPFRRRECAFGLVVANRAARYPATRRELVDGEFPVGAVACTSDSGAPMLESSIGLQILEEFPRFGAPVSLCLAGTRFRSVDTRSSSGTRFPWWCLLSSCTRTRVGASPSR